MAAYPHAELGGGPDQRRIAVAVEIIGVRLRAVAEEQQLITPAPQHVLEVFIKGSLLDLDALGTPLSGGREATRKMSNLRVDHAKPRGTGGGVGAKNHEVIGEIWHRDPLEGAEAVFGPVVTNFEATAPADFERRHDAALKHAIAGGADQGIDGALGTIARHQAVGCDALDGGGDEFDVGAIEHREIGV